MTTKALRELLAADPQAKRMSTTEIARRYGVSQSTAARAKRSLSRTKSAVVVGVDGRRMKVRKIGRALAGVDVERDDKGIPLDRAVAQAESRIIRKARQIRRARAKARYKARVARLVEISKGNRPLEAQYMTPASIKRAWEERQALKDQIADIMNRAGAAKGKCDA